MAVENVVIKITTQAGTKQIRDARQELLKLAAAGELGRTTRKDLLKLFDDNDKKLKRLKKTGESVIKMFTKLNQITLKLFTIGFAIGSAALAANNALFAAGRWAVKMYQAAMQGLAAVVAAVGAGLATVAAAMTEYTAAVNAYAFKSSPALKSRLGESSAALRNIEDDAVLATFGIQSLSGAFAAIAKNSQVTGSSKTFLKGLADFAASGGDPAKQLAAAGEFIGLLQKSGKIDAKVMQAASALGEPFVQAMKKAKAQGMSTIDEFKKMLTSGELARLGGVEGQAGIVASTLMGQLRSLGVQIKSLGTDFGQALLLPVKEAVQEIFDSLQSLIARVGPEMVRFGKGPALQGIVKTVERIEDFGVNLFRKYLAGSEGMLQRFLKWWNQVRFVLDAIVDSLRQLLAGGSIIIDSIIRPVWELLKTTGTWIRYIAETATRNRARFLDFGEALTKFVEKIEEIGKKLIDNFVEAMPFLNQILSWAGNLLDMLMSIVNLIGLMGSGLGSVAGMLGMGDASSGMGGVTKMFGLLLAASVARAQLGRMKILEQKGALNAVGSAVIAAPQQARNRFQTFRQNRAEWKQHKQYMTRRQRVASSNRAMNQRLSGFGIAAGLGVGSLFASEEAQPGMQTGAGIAALAPYLGAAGPAAALAGLGVAGFSMMKNSRTAKGGALGGAMTGAAIGGAIGMVIPILGTAAGMVIGAAAGAIVGWVKGRANADKIVAEKAVSGYMDVQYKGISQALLEGNTMAIRNQAYAMQKRAKELRAIDQQYFNTDERDDRKRTAADLVKKGIITQAEADGLIAAPTTFVDGVTSASNDLIKVGLDMATEMEGASRIAKDSFGMTNDELLQLANATGVNLYDSAVSLQDKFVQLGLAMNYTADQITGAIRDIAIAGLDKFDSKVKQIMSPQVMDELAEGLYQDFITGGEITTERLGSFITDVYNQLNIRNPNNPLGNMQELITMFGPGGTEFQKGKYGGLDQQLVGMESVFAELGMTDLLVGLGADTQAQAATELTDMISKQALFGGVALNREDLMKSLSGMSLTELQKVSDALASGALSPEMLTPGMGGVTRSGMAAGRLKELGLSGIAASEIDRSALTLEQQTELYGDTGMAIITGMNDVIEAAFTKKPDWMTEAPAWYSVEEFGKLIDAYTNDTPTPRGDTSVSKNLRRTMGAHSRINSMFAGKRSVTSSYRTTGLGSINSDHVTGKAYDLIGQNLGAYATMVNRTGGFAEFHGRGGNRHLHVVPGEGPAGDTTAPYMGSVATPAAASSSVNYYNISVTGTPGMDVNMLADAVMAKIQRVDRSNRERS